MNEKRGRACVAGLATAIIILGLAHSAAAQAPCQPVPGTDFTKEVRLLDDADMNGVYSPGDTVGYTIVLCNPDTTACQSTMTDDLDALLVGSGIDPDHLNRVDCPTAAGCPTDGGGLCWKAARADLGDPSLWSPAAVDQCGEACTGQPDDLAFIPTFSFPPLPDAQIGQDECFVWEVCALIGGPITSAECLCDAASASIGAGFVTSHAPGWVSLPPGTGCDDATTCPTPGTQCNACFHLSSNVMLPDLDIDKTALAGTVPPGGTVDFEITVTNIGAAPLASGVLTDTLDPCFEALTDCSTVVCTGGLDCGVCTVTASGFEVTGFQLAEAGQAGDSITWTVTVTAGANPMDCNNTAETSDPDTPSLIATATVTIENAVPDLDIAKRPLSPAVMPGDPVDFEITITNTGAGPMVNGTLTDTLDNCWESLTDCSAVVCTGGVDCGTCALTAQGFEVTGFELAPAGMAGDSITYTVTVIAGTRTGLCSNSVETADPDEPSITDTAQVDIQAALPDLDISKTAAAMTVLAGDPIDFTITVTNVGAGPLASGDLSDTFDPCWEPLADCTAVVCSGGLDCGVCSVRGDGFDITGFQLAEMGMPGDSITYTVTVVAGAMTGSCTNVVETSDPDEPSITDQVIVDIVLDQCDLNSELITFPPVTPAKMAPWVYTLGCGPGDDRLSTFFLGNVGSPMDIDALGGPAGELRLYQLACPCSDRIGLVKGASMVQMQFF